MISIVEIDKTKFEKLCITTKDVNLAKTLMSIVQGELRNWGYVVSDIALNMDSWGEGVLEVEVRTKD